MKKLFLGLTILLLVIVGSVYGLLFTAPGNSYVASLIEEKVNAGQKDVNLKVDDFKLTMSDILFVATIDDNSKINVQGKLAIFSKSVDLTYDVNIKDLSKLKNITKQELKGSFSTKGSVKGNEQLAVIKGESSVASSNTTYDVKLVDFNPSNIVFKMQGAKLEQLLALGNQPIYANGLLDIDANIKSADVKNLDGIVKTTISKGVVNAKAINKELKANPKTPITFKANTTTNLKGVNASTKLNLLSNAATLDVKNAVVNLDRVVVNSDYKLFVKDLSLLEQIINSKFNGSFTTNGNVNITNGVVTVDGDSDIFKSATTYDLKIKDAKPQFVNVNIKKAQITKLLNLVNQPSYASGLVDIDAKIKSADVTNLDGLVLTKISSGKVNHKVVNKAFEQKLTKAITFTGDVKTTLKGVNAISKADVKTSVANLSMKEAVYDISKLAFNSDYTLNAYDLSKLYDVTKQKMRGKAVINGTIKQAPESLSVNGVSTLLGGNVNFDLVNDNFNAKIKDVEVKQLLHMMYYPEIFTSKSDIDINYNLAAQKGKINGGLVNGRFLRNQYSDVINTFAKFDITREVYEYVKLNSDINKNIINSFIDMKSKYTSIKVPSSTLDTEKNYINALVQTTIKKTSFDTTIKGTLPKPRVKVDTKSFLKGKYKEKIDKKKNELKKKLEDKIQKKLGDQFRLDKLFNEAPSNTNPSANQGPSNAEIAKAFKEFFGN